MKVVIVDLEWDEPFLLNLPSRPNIGDGIYLQDCKIKCKNLEYIEEIKHSSRFVVKDIVYGKYQKFNKNRWIIQGELE